MKKNIQRRHKGFSLIEIMVVLVIIGMLASIVGPNVINVLSSGNKQKVKADFSSFETALKMYKVENYVYPSSEQGLDALVSKPTSAPEPRNYPAEGYIPKLPNDPWGNPYQYISPGDSKPYDIYSLGADGINGGEGDDADMSVWDEQS